MIAETRDPAIINEFAAHPDIAPDICGPIDFTNAIRETAVFLFGEYGGFVYEWCAPGTYEAHVMLTKAGRGTWGFAAVRQSLEMMAAKGATHIWCRVREPHVRFFAIHAGFRDAGTQTLYHGDEPQSWPILDWRPPCPLQ